MNEKELDAYIDSLSEKELFEGFNDDIPDAGAAQEELEEDDDIADEAADESEDNADQQKSEEEGSPDEEEDSSDNGDTEETEEEAEDETSDQKFTLKHLDEVREVDRDEVVELAQKGMDYDRVRGKLDRNSAKLEEYENFLKRIAGEQSIEDLIDSTLAKLDVADAEKRGEELDEVEAYKKYRIERVNREVKNPAPVDDEPKPDAAEKEKLGKSIKRFLQEYPNIKADEIAPEVWNDYREGRADLLECYELHENKKLKEELKTLKQNQKNKERSTGSKKSAGKKAADPWFEGWPDD